MEQVVHARLDRREGRRLLDLDALKALACVCVVAYHARYISLAPGGAAPVMYYARSFLACCVPLFFFVHGFLRARRDLTVAQCLARMAKMAALVLIWSLVASVVRTLEGEPPVQGLILDVLALPQGRSNYLWFLISLSAFYALLPLVQLARERSYPLFLWATVGALALCFGVDVVRKLCLVFGAEPWAAPLMGFVTRFPVWGENHGYAFAYCLVGMLVFDGTRGDACGSPRALVADALDSARGIDRAPLLVARGVWWLSERCRATLAVAMIALLPLVMTAFGIYAAELLGSEYDVSWYGYGCWSTLLLVLALYRVASLAAPRAPQWAERLIGLLGRNTMAVYLMHMLVMLPVWAVVPQDGSRAYLLVAGIVVPFLITLVLSLAGELLRRFGPTRWLLSV